MLKINEIFFSIQGESSYAGLPCVFVRLTGCNLRCSYCDTKYAFYEGENFSVDDIFEKVSDYNCNLVEITGGEPLLQKDVYPLITKLCDNGYTVLLETNGSLSIKKVDKRVIKIIDFKTPSSKMGKENFFENIKYLNSKDEVKFVIGSEEDYIWSKNVIRKYNLDNHVTVLFSVVFGKMKESLLVEKILKDNLNVRYQLQLHKYIWKPDEKGV